MLRGPKLKRWGILLAALTLGLALGGATTAGIMFSRQSQPAAVIPALADLQLKASATHGADTYAIATGPVDEDVEGLFTLDFVTGDLNCFVYNPRALSVGGRFYINVNDPKIFGAKKGKKPNFLITTGTLNAGATTGGARLAGSLVYVVDVNSGEVAVFGFPWNKAVTNNGGLQSTPMIPMGKWPTRNIAGQ
jgi:hypothetical protein